MPETTEAFEDTTLDFFEDSEETVDEAQAENNEEAAENTAGEAEQPVIQQETTVDVKFMGKSFPVSEGIVNELAKSLNVEAKDVPAMLQKGLNYDRAVENTPLHKRISKLAELNGMNMDEYQNFLDDAANKIGIRNETQKLKGQYPDLDDTAIEIIAKERLENHRLKDYKDAVEAEKQKATEEAQAKEKELAPYKAFIEKYPEVKEFPPEVAELIAHGTEPIFAYENFMKQKTIEAENQSLKQEKTNYYTTMGSSKGDANPVQDDFLSGFVLD